MEDTRERFASALCSNVIYKHSPASVLRIDRAAATLSRPPNHSRTPRIRRQRIRRLTDRTRRQSRRNTSPAQPIVPILHPGHVAWLAHTIANAAGAAVQRGQVRALAEAGLVVSLAGRGRGGRNACCLRLDEQWACQRASGEDAGVEDGLGD